MQFQDMLEGVQRRLDLDRQNSETLLAATVQALRETAGREAEDLQSQLPTELASISPAGHAPERPADECCIRIGDLCGLDDAQQARAYAQAGFSVLAEAVSAGQLRQLMQALPADYGSLAPKVSGLAGDEETFLAEVRREAKLDDLEQARHLTHAVLAVLGEAASGGQAADVATSLPEDLAAYLRSDQAAQHTEPDRFFDDVTRRSSVTTPEAARSHVAAVWTVLQQWAPTEMASILDQLPQPVARPER